MFLKMEDNHNIFENGRRPEFSYKWKERKLKTSLIFENGRRPQFFDTGRQPLFENVRPQFYFKWKPTSCFGKWKTTSILLKMSFFINCRQHI